MKFTLVATTGIFATLVSTGLANSFSSTASLPIAGTGAEIANVADGADSISIPTDAAEKHHDRASGTTDGESRRGLGEKADGKDPDGQTCSYCCGKGGCR